MREESDLEDELEFDEEDETIEDIGSVLSVQVEAEEGFQIEGEVAPDAVDLDDEDEVLEGEEDEELEES